MNIVSHNILKLSIFVSILFFSNYMYELLNNTNKISTLSSVGKATSTIGSHGFVKNEIPGVEESERIFSSSVGNGRVHLWLSLIYCLFIFFKYKTINEKLGIYILFFIIMNVVYYPVNCNCKKTRGWMCMNNTHPEDKECGKIINDIKETDTVIKNDMEAIEKSKSLVVDALITSLFPIFPVPQIQKINSDAFNLPHLQTINRLIPPVKISCKISGKTFLNLFKKRKSLFKRLRIKR
jgi:hypothetical protein